LTAIRQIIGIGVEISAWIHVQFVLSTRHEKSKYKTSGRWSCRFWQ